MSFPPNIKIFLLIKTIKIVVSTNQLGSQYNNNLINVGILFLSEGHINMNWLIQFQLIFILK